jgi:hypothetical protein
MKWEFTFEQNKKFNGPQQKQGLITKYNIIKNLPGDHFFDIFYKKYYPKVKYENNEN